MLGMSSDKSSMPPAGRGIAVTIRDIDAASDESVLRAGIDRAYEAIRVELAAHTPALTLAAAWPEVLRHSVAAGTRLVADDDETRWTWFVSGSVARGDANGVLASRPRFCRWPSSWSDGIARWSADPREDRGAVMAGLMADSAGVLSRPGIALKLAAIGPVVKIARWAARSAGWLRGGRVCDVVSLSETAPQERAVLRSVAREVAGISRKLTYLASTSTFR
jgi:CBS domain-containing protein